MEQMPSNAPVMESKPGPAGWLQVWIKALTQPNEQTFVDIAESPDATSRTAFIWVFIAGMVSGGAQVIVQAISSLVGVSAQMPFPGMERFLPDGGASPTGMVLVIGFCMIPVYGLLSIVGFAIGTAIIQWIAKLFGGTGTFEKLAYAVAAVTVPFTLVSAVFTLFSAIPFVGICASLLLLGLSLYVLFLEILAVKAINRFGWGQAAGSVLILPGILILCSCLVIIALMLMGPAIGNVFSEINQSLQMTP